MVRMDRTTVEPTSTVTPSPKPVRKISRPPNILESQAILKEIESKKLKHVSVDEDGSKVLAENDETKKSDAIFMIEKSSATKSANSSKASISPQPILFTVDGGTGGARELERLLRIAKRDNQELLTRNRELRNRLKSANANRGMFAEYINGCDKENGENGSNEDLKNTQKSTSVDAETLDDLQHAYDLSDANCAFLEKQNHILAEELRKIESLIDQYKNDMFDQREMCECAQKESRDAGKKLAESGRHVAQLKQEIEYLELDLEYVKSKLVELTHGDVGVSVQVAKPLPVAKRQKREMDETALRHGFDALLTEKNSLLLECESLSAKIKFLEAQNRFALEEARLIHLQSIEQGRGQQVEEKDTREDLSPQFHEIEFIDQQRERTRSVVERESVKSEGLAKRFRKLEKEHLQLYRDYEQQLDVRADIEKKLSALEIEIQVLQSTNKALEEQIIELEEGKEAFASLNSNEELLEGETVTTLSSDSKKSLCFDKKEDLQVIQEDYIQVSSSQEKIDIKKTNGFLRRKNSNLRRESLQAVATKKELELLKEKLDSLEIENSVLKIESMKHSKSRRGSVVSRKLSHTKSLSLPALSEIEFDDSVKKASQSAPTLECQEVPHDQKLNKTKHPDSIQVASQSTQTAMDSKQETSKHQSSMELEFTVEDLTKQNNKLRSKILSFENKTSGLENENAQLEKINLKVLERNSHLREQLEKMQTPVNENGDLGDLTQSAMSLSIDEQPLGGSINLFFKDDILSEYQKAELEEEVKSLKYENQLLKQDLLVKSEQEQILKQKLADKSTILPSVNGEVIPQHEKESSSLKLSPNEQDLDILSSKTDLPSPISRESNKKRTGSLKPSKQDFDILINQIHELEKTRETLSNVNLEHVSTIEQLERQLLYGDQQKSKNQVTGDNKGEKHQKSKSIGEEMLEDADDPNNSFITIEEDNSIMFNRKFLLQSSMPDEKTMTMDETARFSFSREVNDVVNNEEIEDSDSSGGDIEFRGCCIREGELSSEMEDIFLRYTKGEEIASAGEFNPPESHIEDVVVQQDGMSVASVVASTVADVERPVVKAAGRFRSKEDLESTVDRQHKQIETLEQEKQSLVDQLREVQHIARDLSEEGKNLEKQLLVSQQSFMEMSLSLNERIDEVNHYKQRLKSVQKQEQHSSNEILDLEAKLNVKDTEYKELMIRVEGCNYKLESSRRECNEYRVIVDEQERMINEAHHSNSTMQRNFNEIYREVKEKKERLETCSKDLARSVEKVKELERDKAGLVGSLARSVEEVKELERDKAGLVERIDSLEGETRRRQTKTDTWENENKKQKAEVRNLLYLNHYMKGKERPYLFSFNYVQ